MSLPDQIKEKLQGLDEKQTYMLLGGILFLIFILDYFILLGPQLKVLTKISPEIKILSKDIKEAKSNIQRFEQYHADVNKLKVEMIGVNANIVSREEMPMILEAVSTIAYKNGVKIDQIMPVSEDQYMILDNNDRQFFSLPIRVEAESGYHNFGRFLNQLEKEKIYLNVRKFTIASIDDSKHHVINLTLEAIVYENVEKEYNL